MHEGKDVENVHTKFCKRILSVRKSTNIAALYGELGRYPLSVMRKLSMVKYWFKLLKLPENAICKLVYNKMRDDANQNITYNGCNWAYQIKSLLESHGLYYLWLDQDTSASFDIIRNRIYDNFKQSWYANINNSQRLLSYCRFKHEFCFEKYLTILTEKKYRTALTRFRVSSHSLKIESGRYENISRENRTCNKCSMNVIENEFHFLLVCPFYREIRKRFLKSFYCHWPTLNKFDMLMSSENKASIIRLSKYIYFATKLRD